MGGWGQAREGPVILGKVREGGGRAEHCTQSSTGWLMLQRRKGLRPDFSDSSAEVLDLGDPWGCLGGRDKKEGKEAKVQETQKVREPRRQRKLETKTAKVRARNTEKNPMRFNAETINRNMDKD